MESRTNAIVAVANKWIGRIFAGMKYGLILILLSLATGCSTDYVDGNESIYRFRNKITPKDTSYILTGMAKPDYSLYCTDGDKAKFKIERRNLYKYENGIKVYWETGRNGSSFRRKFDPYHIARKCEPYIKNSSAGKMTFEQYQSFFERKLKDAENGHVSISRKYLKLAFEKGFITAEKIGQKYWIVCLDPLVVVTLDMDNISWNRLFSYRSILQDVLYFMDKDGYFYKYDPLNEYRGRVGSSSNLALIASGMILPYGLDYGLEMPYVENPRWFSPDMKVKDQPVEMVSETKGQIKVPWGYLYLTKQNNNWVVTVEKK